MSIDARLAELGIELPVAAAPVAAYVPVVVHGGVAYVSGQLPFVDGALVTSHEAELRELCNCSAVTVTQAAERQITVQVAGEAGRKKCERCWHWELNVGENPSHPTLCARCVEAVIPLA